MDEADRPPGRALPRDPPSNAPASPRVQQWNRRIVGWGLAPLLLTGMIAGLMPGGAQTVSLAGAVLVVAVTVPVTAHAWRLRRRNQAAYRTAVDAARDEGRIVRVVETSGGDFHYVLSDAPVVERVSWT